MKAKNRRITYLAVAGVAVLAILGGATIAANIQSNNLDLLLGRGKEHKIKASEGLDGNYIDYKFSKQGEWSDPLEKEDTALGNAQKLTRLVAEEGMTLLKNDDNALPLASAEKVTVLGYKSWHNNTS